MTSPTSFSTTMQETVKTTVPIPTTSHPASTEQERPTKATTTSDKHTGKKNHQVMRFINDCNALQHGRVISLECIVNGKAMIFTL